MTHLLDLHGQYISPVSKMQQHPSTSANDIDKLRALHNSSSFSSLAHQFIAEKAVMQRQHTTRVPRHGPSA